MDVTINEWKDMNHEPQVLRIHLISVVFITSTWNKVYDAVNNSQESFDKNELSLKATFCLNYINIAIPSTYRINSVNDTASIIILMKWSLRNGWKGSVRQFKRT